MKFKGHQTFYIRRGWLTKGLRKIKETENYKFFTDKTIDKTTELGVGSNMVNAIRYYLPAVGLTVEERGNGQFPTSFGENVYNYDKYMQQYGTLLWLHYQIATNNELATSWYYFFNEYKSMEVEEDSFIENIKDYITQVDKEQLPAEKSLKDDYTCIINTYLPRENDKDSFEDNLECPLAELHLLTQTNLATGKIIRKTPCDVSNFPSYIALAVLKNLAEDTEQNEIKIENIEKSPKSLGKVFNLGILDVATILERLQNEGLIKIIRTAGIENVQFTDKTKELSVANCLENYYKSVQ